MGDVRIWINEELDLLAELSALLLRKGYGMCLLDFGHSDLYQWKAMVVGLSIKFVISRCLIIQVKE